MTPANSVEKEAIRAIFNRIAPVYDDLNDRISLGQHHIWKAMAVKWAQPRPGDRALDLCCGSGDLAERLARAVGPRGSVVGVDFAAAPLGLAAQRFAQRCPHLQATWIEADVTALPFEDASFDCATMAYGLRNVTDIPGGLAELRRVLKPGGKAAILDFHRPRDPQLQRLQTWYLANVVEPLAKAWGFEEEYAYIGPSVERFPQGDHQVALARSIGFSRAIHYDLIAEMMGVLVVTA